MQYPVEDGRLYLPPEDPAKPNDRNAIHPETNSGQVLMDDTGTTLKDYVGYQPLLSSEQPAREALWLKITATE